MEVEPQAKITKAKLPNSYEKISYVSSVSPTHLYRIMDDNLIIKRSRTYMKNLGSRTTLPPPSEWTGWGYQQNYQVYLKMKLDASKRTWGTIVYVEKLTCKKQLLTNEVRCFIYVIIYGLVDYCSTSSMNLKLLPTCILRRILSKDESGTMHHSWSNVDEVTGSFKFGQWEEALLFKAHV